MKYLNLPKNYSMTDLVGAYKCAVKKFHPIRTKTSSHLYKINSEYAQKKALFRMREVAYKCVNIDVIERARCQCGHFYDMGMVDGDYLECEWCSLKVKITGKNKLA